MGLVNIKLLNKDAFIAKAIRNIVNNISPKVSSVVTSGYVVAKNTLDGDNVLNRELNYTGALRAKLTLSTYKAGSRGGSLKGKFINPEDQRLFIARPSAEDIKKLEGLEFGIFPYDWNKDIENIKAWSKQKLGIEQDQIKVAETQNSAYYKRTNQDIGMSPIIRAKYHIMLELERLMNIKFN
jgi:hypothetical protein